MRRAATKEELERGVRLGTAQRWTLEVDRSVELMVVVRQRTGTKLPNDLTLTLRGTEHGDLAIALPEAERRGGTLVFAFRWSEPQRAVSLSASAGSRTLTLWSERVVDSLDPIEWGARLEQWLAARVEHESLEQREESGHGEG